MSPRPSRANLLDVLPEFDADEELTAIHVRPTISMPPFPFARAEAANDLVISSTIAALVDESEVEESMIEEAPEQDDIVTEVAMRPAPMPSSMATPAAPAPASKPSSSRFAFAPIAMTITALGF